MCSVMVTINNDDYISVLVAFLVHFRLGFRRASGRWLRSTISRSESEELSTVRLAALFLVTVLGVLLDLVVRAPKATETESSCPRGIYPFCSSSAAAFGTRASCSFLAKLTNNFSRYSRASCRFRKAGSRHTYDTQTTVTIHSHIAKM